MDNRNVKIIIMALLGAWIIFPDLVPGHVDDIIALIALLSQLSMPKKEGSEPELIETKDLEIK